MSYGQNSAVYKLLWNYFLDDGIVFDINIGSCLVYQNDFTVFKESSANAQKLFFSSRQALIWYRAI